MQNMYQSIYYGKLDNKGNSYNLKSGYMILN